MTLPRNDVLVDAIHTLRQKSKTKKRGKKAKKTKHSKRRAKKTSKKTRRVGEGCGCGG